MDTKTSTGFRGILLCLAIFAIVSGAADDSLAAKCSAQFQKVTECLPFATAKSAAPSKDCCDSVADLKESDPACLCFIIQQIHNGSNAAVKSMGVQETRLLQLPSACKLANTSISECPRLLHMPLNSPDASIFTNASTAATPPNMGTSSPTSTASNGFWHKPQLAGCSVFTISMAITVFFVRAIPMSS